MTDVQPTEPTSGLSGVWTPEQVRELIQMGPNVGAIARGSRLDVEEATSQIATMLMPFVKQKAWWATAFDMIGTAADRVEVDTDVEPIAKLIAQSIPSELLNTTALATLDLRPYLQLFADNPNMLMRKERVFSRDADVDRSALSASLVNELTMHGQDEVLNLLVSAPDMSAEERQQLADSESRFVSGIVDVKPLVRFNQRMAGGQVEDLPGEQGASFDGSTVYAETALGYVWDLDYDLAMREAATTPSGEAYSTFAPIMQQEAEYNEMVGTPGQIRSGITLSEGQTPAGSRMRKLSLQQALTYMDKLDDREFGAMQAEMYKAGFYDRLGTGYAPGDRADKATTQAWQLLLVDAYKTRKPIMNILEDNAVRRQQAYREQWRGQLATNLLDAADSIGMEMFGRRLTNTEYQAVRSFITKAQGTRIPAGDSSWYTEDRAEFGFDVQDIEAGLNQMPGGGRAIMSPDASSSFDKMAEYWREKRG